MAIIPFFQNNIVKISKDSSTVNDSNSEIVRFDCCLFEVADIFLLYNDFERLSV